MDYETDLSGTTIRTHAVSSSFDSLFYPVDNMAVSTLYPDGYPGKYTIETREGRYRRHKVTYFEKKEEGKPQKVIFNDLRDNETKEYFLDKQAHDPLSALYAVTKMSLAPDKSIYIDIFDSKKIWHTEVQVLRKEKIKIESREYRTGRARQTRAGIQRVAITSTSRAPSRA